MKFLVLWQIDLAMVSADAARAVGRMPDYGARLETEGKVLARYHIVGAHGGAWIYDVGSHEEFERLLARAPVFNIATYTVHALAAMGDEPDSASPAGSEGT
ncbi:muconolactone Delta-isomerase family protein [Flexivirga alba]|uniref:Muconolactone Delta-isomerase family protein n=1 Tax=Flexivirga alba TaxID=702742 RepID=A0ABW2AL06_9MICO